MRYVYGMANRYGLGDRTHSAIAFIKGTMTKNMAAYMSDVQEEVRFALNDQIGDCQGSLYSSLHI